MSDAEHKPCTACPVEVRGLYASAHNALGAWKRGDKPDRVRHKMDELADAIALLAPLVDAHFREMHAIEDAARIIAKNRSSTSTV